MAGTRWRDKFRSIFNEPMPASIEPLYRGVRGGENKEFTPNSQK